MFRERVKKMDKSFPDEILQKDGYIIAHESLKYLFEYNSLKIENTELPNEKLSKHLKKANSYLEKDEHGKAAVQLKKAAKLDPENLDIRNIQAKNYMIMWMSNINKNEGLTDIYLKSADVVYDRVLKLNLEDYKAWFAQGLSNLLLERYDKAKKCFDKSLAIYPDFPDAWNNKGISFIENNKYLLASHCFDKALKMSPNNDLFLKNQNLLQSKTPIQNDNNIDTNKKPLEPIKPDAKGNQKVLNLNEKGYSFFLQGDFKRALSFYDEALLLDPNNPTILYNISLTYKELGDYVSGIKTIKEALKINPNSDSALKLKEELIILHTPKSKFDDGIVMTLFGIILWIIIFAIHSYLPNWIVYFVLAAGAFLFISGIDLINKYYKPSRPKNTAKTKK